MEFAQVVEGVMLGGFIGLVLATVGAGGAILAVPGLVGFFGLTAIEATTSSLVVVGAAALTGAIQKLRAGAADLRLGLLFSIVGAAGTFLGTKLVAVIPETLLLVLFSVLILMSAYGMWNKKPINEGKQLSGKFAVFLVASGVGLITGLLGVGGGFLIVPALVLTLGINAHLAVGTSLVAIFTNTVLALGMRSQYWHDIPWEVVSIVAMSAIVVSAIAAPLSHKISATKIQKTFAVLLLLVTTYMLSLAISG